MLDKTITVKIDKAGRPKIEAHGFNGQGCREATAPIEKAYGMSEDDGEVELKQEFYEEEEQEQGF